MNFNCLSKKTNYFALLCSVLIFLAFSEDQCRAIPTTITDDAELACAEPLLGEALESGKLNGITLRITDILQGSHGGHRYVVERFPSRPWGNFDNRAAPQGDPRLIFDYLDEQTARFFGFSRKMGFWGTRSVTLPNILEMQGAIRNYNVLARAQNLSGIRMTIYEENNLHAPPEQYLRWFASKWALPIASEGTFFHHDMNFHAATVLFMPHEYTVHAARQRTALLDFKAWLESRYPKQMQRPLIEAFWTVILRDQANYLDVSTGALHQLLSLRQGSNSNHDGAALPFGFGAKPYYRNLDRYCFGGISPRRFLEGIFRQGYIQISGPKRDVREAQNEFQMLITRFQEFKRIMTAETPKFSQPLGLPAKSRDIVVQAENEIAQIRQVIRAGQF